jgi:hypothetical protein
VEVHIAGACIPPGRPRDGSHEGYCELLFFITLTYVDTSGNFIMREETDGKAGASVLIIPFVECCVIAVGPEAHGEIGSTWTSVITSIRLLLI